MLLWHGSRLTNWVGILSQGLRIAPPEAPVTGYMVRIVETAMASERFCKAKSTQLQNRQTLLGLALVVVKK